MSRISYYLVQIEIYLKICNMDVEDIFSVDLLASILCTFKKFLNTKFILEYNLKEIIGIFIQDYPPVVGHKPFIINSNKQCTSHIGNFKRINS